MPFSSLYLILTILLVNDSVFNRLILPLSNWSNG